MNLTGSCYCGKCRWESDGEPNWVCTCHCESCRRNCAAPFTTFFGMNNERWKWTGDLPRKIQSTEGVTRFFCNDCGTPVGYHNIKWDHETHFYVVSIEDPSLLPPQYHVHWNERLPWITLDDDLPRYPGSADASQ